MQETRQITTLLTISSLQIHQTNCYQGYCRQSEHCDPRWLRSKYTWIHLQNTNSWKNVSNSLYSDCQHNPYRIYDFFEMVNPETLKMPPNNVFFSYLPLMDPSIREKLKKKLKT